FTTETDTEVIAHLVEGLRPGRSLAEAVRATLTRLRGSYALALISADAPRTIIAARSGPPLAIGLGADEVLVASDVPPLLEHTRNVYFLNDGEMAILCAGGAKVENFQGSPVPFAAQEVGWTPEMAEKG